MKLTIEPTEQGVNSFGVDATQQKVTVEIPADDLTIEEMFENLIIPALLGMEFHRDSITDYLDA